MKLLDSLRARFAALFRHSELNTEMDEEVASHIQLRADDLERSGVPRPEAERRARIEFGGQEHYKEEMHEAMGGSFVETLFNDVRYSLRLLKKSPGFTIVAIATLALAIGANAVVFAVLNALILQPLNLPREKSLYSIERGENGYVSYPDYVDMRDRNHSFEAIAAFDITEVAMDAGNDASLAWVYEVSGNYFDALYVEPSLGRFFHAADEHGANSAPFVVLGHAYWHRQFHDDPNVVGQTVQLNKHPYTIIGITTAEFRGTLQFMPPDIYVPLVNHDELAGTNELNRRSSHWVFDTVGHLKPGVTTQQAAADLNSIGDDLQKTYPSEEPGWRFRLARPALYGNFLGNPIKAFLAGLTVLAVLILLAACANLGSLFAARATDRGREIALRLALGSSRRRVLRQLLTEAVLISVAGGSVGLLGSLVLLRRLSVWQPFPRFPLHVPVLPDVKVYLLALLLALVSGFLFGIVPTRQVLRANPYEVVKSGSSGIIGRRVSARDFLLVTQIAICAVLVTSSIVAVRGLVRSLHSDFGFNPQNALLASTSLSMAGYNGDKVPAMQRRMIDSMATLPTVSSVGLADRFPLNMDGEVKPIFTDKTTDFKPANAVAQAWLYRVSPGYFDAAGTTLLTGRSFSWHDDNNAPRVAVVNRELARVVFGSPAAAIDYHFKMKDGTLIQVVGVVEDGKYFNLAEDQKPALFLPLLQSPATDGWMVVRSTADPQQVAPAVRNKFRDLDAALPIYLQPWTKELDDALFPSRVATLSLGVLGMMGAMLSITGIFGMAAYSVSKRMRELGIRIALGARREEVLRAALGRAIRLLALGSVAGLILGLLGTKILGVIVYQASPRDPLVLFGAVLAMALLGLVATWIPAQRALSVDPLILLRDE
jgi:predicted permease